MDNEQPTISDGGDFAIHHDLWLNATKKTVFEAVSLLNQLNNWWTLRCSGEPMEGTEYNFYFAPDYDWLGKVIKYEPDQAFYIKMTKSDSDWESTSFGFDLEEVNAGVQQNSDTKVGQHPIIISEGQHIAGLCC